MRKFSAIYAVGGEIRRMVFEAVDLDDARALAKQWGVGVEGEALDQIPAEAVLPEAYDLKTTCRLLGGISRGTAYNWQSLDILERMPNTTKVLFTRRSVEAAKLRKRRA